MIKNIILLLLIFSVILILCSVTRSSEAYRPFVTLYGTNPIRQRRSGWRNYFGGYGGNEYGNEYGGGGYGCQACPYGGGCPGCPFAHQFPTDTPQRQLGFTPYGEGMYTSTYGDVCSRYGSSTIDADPSTYYMGSRWCPVGVVSNPSASEKLSSTQALEARFMGNSWSFRVRDGLTGMHIYLNTVGQGPYGAYRDGDVIQIPGKEGDWKVQVQTQYQPYLLYLPF
jgi:hypothetical protein